MIRRHHMRSPTARKKPSPPEQTLNEHILSFEETVACPYAQDGRTATVEYILPRQDGAQNFHLFLARGYRRLGIIFYRNICQPCSSCVPIRTETDRFTLSRSQKRTVKKNEDLKVKIRRNTTLTQEKVELYRKYVHSRHGEPAERELVDFDTALSSIHYGYDRVIEMDYYLGDRLIGVGIVDEGVDSLSSNYFYYDTEFLSRRLGVFSILREISLARLLGKRYYYLGFYIEETRTMSYKRFFRPNQLLIDGTWKEFLK